jgi:DNA-binding protein HU-beta
MRKLELIEAITKNANISKATARDALNAILSEITIALKKEESVILVGFGTFKVSRRAARIGRNPQTGEALKIKAAKIPKFSAGKLLKDAVN